VLPDAAVTFQVTATRAERARLVFTGSGTEMAWNAQVVAEDRTAGDGLRRTWHPDHGVFGSLGIQVVGPGGVASKDLGPGPQRVDPRGACQPSSRRLAADPGCAGRPGLRRSGIIPAVCGPGQIVTAPNPDRSRQRLGPSGRYSAAPLIRTLVPSARTNTPLRGLWIRRGRSIRRVWLKLETHNPTGSIKYRTALGLLAALDA